VVEADLAAWNDSSIAPRLPATRTKVASGTARGAQYG
jgi:hypothetical protein